MSNDDPETEDAFLTAAGTGLPDLRTALFWRRYDDIRRVTQALKAAARLARGKRAEEALHRLDLAAAQGEERELMLSVIGAEDELNRLVDEIGQRRIAASGRRGPGREM